MKWVASVLGLVTMGLGLTFCDSGAINPNACRSIEQKRCTLLAGCAGFDLDEESEVTACQLFYRDQCIFGLSADVARDPDDNEVEQCLIALDQAAACKGGDGTIGGCADAPQIDASYNPDPAVDGRVDAASATACQVLQYPSYLTSCAFLQAREQTSEGGSEGSGGSDGAGGGTGGTGGS